MTASACYRGAAKKPEQENVGHVTRARNNPCVGPMEEGTGRDVLLGIPFDKAPLDLCRCYS